MQKIWAGISPKRDTMTKNSQLLNLTNDGKMQIEKVFSILPLCNKNEQSDKVRMHDKNFFSTGGGNL